MLKRRTLQAGSAAALALLGAAVAHAAQQPAFRSSNSPAERECLARAMYFESNKSSEDGMLAVGTVVANRLQSGRYGTNACAVVGQRGQFAPGVLTRGMGGEAAMRARRVAQAVLGGHRHPAVRNAMFFHTAGLRFGYGNMHYLTVAGGNIFYEKRSATSSAAARANALSMARAYASAANDKAAAGPVLAMALRSNPVTTPLPQPAPAVVALNAPIRFGTAPLQSSAFTTASAYGEATVVTPQANSALAAVAALAPKKAQTGPRVIAPAAPVQASMTPVAAARFAPKPNPMANFAVAMAWSSFN